MNIERMKELRDFVKKLPAKQFHMGTWGRYGKKGDYTPATSNELMGTPPHGCGTAACLAGWACALWDRGTERYDSFYFNKPQRAELYLELTLWERRSLFTPNEDTGCVDLNTISKTQALAVLDHCVACKTVPEGVFAMFDRKGKPTAQFIPA